MMPAYQFDINGISIEVLNLPEVTEDEAAKYVEFARQADNSVKECIAVSAEQAGLVNIFYAKAEYLDQIQEKVVLKNPLSPLPCLTVKRNETPPPDSSNLDRLLHSFLDTF